jgi:hypothetical protein
MNIRILRLVTGEDIVGTVEKYGDKVTVYEPMMVMMNFRGNSNQGTLQMSHWLPLQLVRENVAVISTKDILTILEPEDEFAEYYENAVEKIKHLMDAKQELDSNLDTLTDQEIMDIMESMSLNSNQIVH